MIRRIYKLLLLIAPLMCTAPAFAMELLERVSKELEAEGKIDPVRENWGNFIKGAQRESKIGEDLYTPTIQGFLDDARNNPNAVDATGQNIYLQRATLTLKCLRLMKDLTALSSLKGVLKKLPTLSDEAVGEKNFLQALQQKVGDLDTKIVATAMKFRNTEQQIQAIDDNILQYHSKALPSYFRRKMAQATKKLDTIKEQSETEIAPRRAVYHQEMQELAKDMKQYPTLEPLYKTLIENMYNLYGDMQKLNYISNIQRYFMPVGSNDAYSRAVMLHPLNLRSPGELNQEMEKINQSIANNSVQIAEIKQEIEDQKPGAKK